jgi:predicted PolB exonuclease-like 3'-5' exonuclease
VIAFDLETIPNEAAIKSGAFEAYLARHQEKKESDAALHPAFTQIVCVCAYDTDSKRKFKKASVDEKDLVSNFLGFISETKDPVIFGGHNIKGFDIPVIACRILAHGLQIPASLRVAGKKPWEIPHIDTVEIMKFGAGPYISLDAMCLILGVSSPKNGDVKGDGVWDAYKENKLDEIADYCGRDVNSWMHCYNKLRNAGVIE